MHIFVKIFYYNKMQKHCPKASKLPSFNFMDDSPITNNFLPTKQNCMSLSNQSQSLLVSSLRASSSHNGGSNMKKQKRLNSDFLINQRNKTSQPFNSINSLNKNPNITITQCLHHNSFTQLSISNASNKPCPACAKQLPELREKLQKAAHRLQEVQALIKICFTKNLSLQNSFTQKNQQILQIKTRLDETERVVKKNQQVLIKHSVSKTMESDEIKNITTKLSDKLSQKTKQLNEIIELQKGILEQKISKISTFYEQKFDSLIGMVQQLAKTQEKIVNSQRQTTLSKIDFDSSQQITSLNQKYMLPTQPRNRIPSSDKARNQSKSKISYYLSKSNFNDTTTLGDTTINQLSAIGGIY